MAKKKKVVKFGSKKGAKYFVRDVADRDFKEEVDGFDLKLVAGVKVEVSKKVALAAKKAFPYLEVVEA